MKEKTDQRKDNWQFPNVSLLITHYNRSSSLERLLDTFSNIHCQFSEIVVSDDCSNSEHLEVLEKLQKKYGFTLVTTPQNKGLGNNINKGFDACKTDYILYVQEDFVPEPVFPKSLTDALNILDEDASIDMARFYAYCDYPYLKDFRDGFSKMDFKITKPGYSKFYMYSDHPHLKRKTFTKRFGRYFEDRKSDKIEYMMMISFLQKKGKAIFYNNFHSLFDHVNDVEPSSINRNNWEQTRRSSKNVLIKLIRILYRNVKFNFDYFFVNTYRK